MNTYHLRLEAVNLDAFIHDTNLLSAIRGGGLLLLRATDRVRARFPDLKPITTGASTGVFEVSAADDRAAAKMRDDVDDFLRTDERLRHATFVVDVVRAGDYGTSREALRALNRWRQWRRPTVALPSTPTAGHGVCRVDGVRPASAEKVRKGTDEPLAASKSVYLRWEHGKREKQAFYKEETGVDARFTNDFDELANDGRRGNLDGKMAVIYADGNAFGQIQRRHCTTTAKQREFDGYVKDKRRAWLRAFLERAQVQGSGFHRGDELRIETLLWGGDEMLLVVPAWRGWWTLAFFFEQSADWQIFDQRLTHAAGLVFCHHNAPIRRVRALAKKLADLVKDQAGRDESRCTYQVLESFDHVGRDPDEFRRSRWPRTNELILAGRDMPAVRDHVKPLASEEFPRSKLHAIAKTLARDAVGPAPADGERIASWIEQACAGRPKSKEALMALGACFPGEDAGTVKWLHVAELWDYLTAA